MTHGRRGGRFLLATALAVVAASGTAHGTAAQATHTLRDVDFLAGCWAGRMGALDMMEQWTRAEGGLMLGTTRYLRDGEIAGFEFARIEEDDAGVTLWPYPSGVVSEHGFPVRVVYVRVGEDGLEPRIEGSDGSGTGWTLNRVACP